jgi:hypothetical protein
VVSSPNDRRDAGQGASGNARGCNRHASSYNWPLRLHNGWMITYDRRLIQITPIYSYPIDCPQQDATGTFSVDMQLLPHAFPDNTACIVEL